MAKRPHNGNKPHKAGEKKVVIVIPAYNAEKTLRKTFADIPAGCADKILLVDDNSSDNTVQVAKTLGIEVICHNRNSGYGANQKTCYDTALKTGADIVVMIHPDYQYDSRVIPYAVGFLTTGICDVIIGSRIRTRRETLDGGMPLYKYLANRILTVIENMVLGQNLGDFHSGFRAYTREVLETIPYNRNSDGFVFDSQFLVQSVYFGFRIGDIPIPTRYFEHASSINFAQSVIYGLRTIVCLLQFVIQKSHLYKFRLFSS